MSRFSHWVVASFFIISAAVLAWVMIASNHYPNVPWPIGWTSTPYGLIIMKLLLVSSPVLGIASIVLLVKNMVLLRGAGRRASGFLLIPAILVVGLFIFLGMPRDGSISKKNRWAREGERQIASALEAYRAEHKAFPATHPLSHPGGTQEGENDLVQQNAQSLSVVEVGQPSVGLAGLTTPIAYIQQVPKDPYFWVRNESLPCAYYTDGVGWILISPGPDGHFDVEAPADFGKGVGKGMRKITNKVYDPTNGLVSRGDIVLSSMEWERIRER